MTQDYQEPQAPQPPMPPTELVQVWWSHMWSPYNVARCAATWAWEQAMTTLAEREQAAADAQLMAVNDWLRCLEKGPITGIRAELTPSQLERLACELRAARRPKPPTQAERGLSVLDACGDNIGPANERELRTALLRLQELEQTATTTATTETTHD